MSTLVDAPLSGTDANAAQRLRTTMAAVRVSMSWLGTKKSLTAEQKAEAAEPFGADARFLSAGKRLLDTTHPAYKAVTAGGQVRCIYSEEIDLSTLGSPVIRRASHVEPDQHGRWLADLSPVGGPLLGPYPSRSEALAAEATWLETRWLAQPESETAPGWDLPTGAK